jgi:putative N6-adenine-specific DNA methylase
MTTLTAHRELHTANLTLVTCAMSRILITSPALITPYLRQEVEALGYAILAEHAAGVEVEGTFADCMRLNMKVRTGHRVLWKLGEGRATSADDMYDLTRSIAWEDVIPADGYLAVVSSVSTPQIDNTLFANRKCKDAIVDRIRAKKGRRPDSGPLTDRAVVFLYWHDDTCIIYLDTSGTPLSDRGYRTNPGKAPMRESLAAAVIMATTWKPGEAFVNPMCGSGTLAIEAALMSGNIAPGLFRADFAFRHTLLHDERAWRRMVTETQEEIRWEGGAIIATDHDRRMIEATRTNIASAGIEGRIDVRVCDFRETPLPEPPGVIVINPEYGLRIGDSERLAETYAEIGDWFKKSCTGFTGYVFTGNLPLSKRVGLRSTRRIPFWNADIDCRLVEFPLYEGSRKGS